MDIINATRDYQADLAALFDDIFPDGVSGICFAYAEFCFEVFEELTLHRFWSLKRLVKFGPLVAEYADVDHMSRDLFEWHYPFPKVVHLLCEFMNLGTDRFVAQLFRDLEAFRGNWGDSLYHRLTRDCYRLACYSGCRCGRPVVP